MIKYFMKGVIKIDINSIKIEKDYLNKIVKNKDYNKTIINYYKRLVTEDKFIKIAKDKVERVEDCNRFWQLDKYKIQKIKDFKKTNLCKDKFCSNCKKVIQAARMSRFIPEIEKINDKYVLYHLTLTVPNCCGADLRDTIKNIFNSFKTLIEYLKLKKKIRGVDFSSWGYGGAIRSLEITFKKDSYHPHLHVLFAVEKDMLLVKNNVNDYSYSYGEFKRCFSEREILIQKVWYLLINGIRVTKKNIDNLDIGYSCNMDKFKKDDYAELFKYLTKEQDEEQNVLSYENFKVLYSATYKCRQIQGYGCFYNLDFNEVDENEVDEIYSDIIEELQKKELPEDTFETPEALLKDSQYLLISRKKIFSYLRLK